MQNLTMHEVKAVSGASFDIFDLAYLWAGYNNLGLVNTMLVGATVGLGLGLINVMMPASGSVVVGASSTATWILLPGMMGAGLAAVEYYIGSCAASWSTVSSSK